MSDGRVQKELVGVGKGHRIREVTTVYDSAGNVVHKLVEPIMVLFRSHDVVQVVVGASLLAIPMAYTEETWRLGEQLALRNVFFLAAMSIVFIALFVYYNFYGEHIRTHSLEFVKRTFSIYLISLIVVGLFLTIIEQAPWMTDWLLALKRTIIVAVPASMSASVADMIK